MDPLEPNDAMLARLNNEFNNEQTATGADVNFYVHESLEDGLMNQGMDYDAAHATALDLDNMSNFGLYHPDVINEYTEHFNSSCRNFWGLSQ